MPLSLLAPLPSPPPPRHSLRLPNSPFPFPASPPSTLLLSPAASGPHLPFLPPPCTPHPSYFCSMPTASILAPAKPHSSSVEPALLVQPGPIVAVLAPHCCCYRATLELQQLSALLHDCKMMGFPCPPHIKSVCGGGEILSSN